MDAKNDSATETYLRQALHEATTNYIDTHRSSLKGTGKLARFQAIANAIANATQQPTPAKGQVCSGCEGTCFVRVSSEDGKGSSAFGEPVTLGKRSASSSSEEMPFE